MFFDIGVKMEVTSRDLCEKKCLSLGRLRGYKKLANVTSLKLGVLAPQRNHVNSCCQRMTNPEASQIMQWVKNCSLLQAHKLTKSWCDSYQMRE